MTNVFIAPKIRVGFQKRDDCFTGKLAYIIYYDDKGKIRKEKSWNTWRSKTIPAEEFDNTPMDGFTLNKDVKRYSGDWFSSHRTLIRVHDPRGFEFEVTTENLIGILMHTDCLRRGLIGQFVYAWVGPELVLLPTNSEDYQSAIKYTAGLSKTVKAKEMVPGISYKTKREGDVVFLGKLNWYSYSTKGYNLQGLRNESKVLVFTNDDGKTFFNKPSAGFLSEANSNTPVSNFAELMQKFNKKTYANKIVRYEFRPVEFSPDYRDTDWYGPQLCRSTYFVQSSVAGVFREQQVSLIKSRLPEEGGKKASYSIDGYEFLPDRFRDNRGMKASDGELVDIPSAAPKPSFYYCDYNNKPKQNLSYMKSQKFYDLYIIFENGKEKRITCLYEMTQEIE